ncbi:GDP-Man:Man(3)GlcNAc(2)-PP-Dol alpha-1,2-mannosyltransferase [Dendrobium catenatum]|uniref:GDP-Man:Man(3)GlcNAc(2)-PP-Dol alpha-1,2-mannosyltransferase n=1 Tax=Dendrobium catenatum TaxID=906689 RepID=A0A2I0X431_9ASPA|nr:GDP-Man:Man(3)GlcNAc(2)-PP-Dol alpha-1,2-mannosyltransferase [Dendrobium catenatum]
MDIILEEDGKPSGFLASNKEEYADAILKVLRLKEAERLEIAATARKHFLLEASYNQFGKFTSNSPTPGSLGAAEFKIQNTGDRLSLGSQKDPSFSSPLPAF